MNLRILDTCLITEAVEKMCIEANKTLPYDLQKRIVSAEKCEEADLPKSILQDMVRNIEAAQELNLPICQDTGMAVIFLEVGQDVHLVGDALEDAVNKGVHDGYVNGLLRCSIVKDPLRRVNTNDNTPAVIHTRIVPGDKVKITVAPKGFGSENMSTVKMCLPSASQEQIINYIVDAVVHAGSNPCPPIVVGVGIGGDFEHCAYLAKKALCRDIDVRNTDDYYAQMEEKCLNLINATGIGPQGFGGKTTALAVNIETYPTHIAGLPLAINIGCHVTRHITTIL